MTNKEKEATIYYLKGLIKDVPTPMLQFEHEKEIVLEALDALEQADKYRWHDLRKNPEDLPPVNPINSFDEDVLLMVRGEASTDSNAKCYKGHLTSLEPKAGVSDGSDNFWGMPTYESEWCIWGWGYYKKPIVIAWRYIEPFDVPDIRVGESGGAE